ncbi:hypothetical protein, partial [Streptococcus pseudopneumoniae]|uniref:hypothetical protein n=1 Tax=Streptococcus pseudopneumoniae TaxID=257758 RepID=UPI001BB1EF6C
LSPDRFNPLPHDSQAWESLLGSPVAGAHRGLTPQMHDMPVVPEKSRKNFLLQFSTLVLHHCLLCSHPPSY